MNQNVQINLQNKCGASVHQETIRLIAVDRQSNYKAVNHYHANRNVSATFMTEFYLKRNKMMKN